MNTSTRVTLDTVTKSAEQSAAAAGELRYQAARAVAAHYSIADVAAAAGVTRQTIYRWVEQHKLPTSAQFEAEIRSCVDKALEVWPDNPYWGPTMGELLSDLYPRMVEDVCEGYEYELDPEMDRDNPENSPLPVKASPQLTAWCRVMSDAGIDWSDLS